METTTTTRPSLRWRILRWALIGLAGLVTLVAVIWAEENWRGKRAWESHKSEWEAKGEKLDLQAHIPPPVPDGENFAMTPFLAPLYDLNPKPLAKGQSYWRDTNAVQKTRDYGSEMGYPKASLAWEQAEWTDLTAWSSALDGKKNAPPSGETPAQRAASAEAVLRKLEKYDPVMEELRAASKRPYSRFNIGYEDEDPMMILLPHLAVLKRFGMLYQLRASAELAAGRDEAAMADIHMGFYLAESVNTEPILISSLVRIAIVDITLRSVWEGMAEHRFNEAQLKDLQAQLGKLDFLKDFGTTMRAEWAFNNKALDYFRRVGHIAVSRGEFQMDEQPVPMIPGAVYYQNKVAFGRMYDKVILPQVDADKHRVYVELAAKGPVKLEAELRGGFPPYTSFVKLLFPAVAKTAEKFAKAQANVDEAVIACALERYRLAHGQYPDSLDALSPQLIEKVPMDVITGEPLKYRRMPDGQFLLYSVGWNGTDDGGIVAHTSGTTPRQDVDRGDWVWRYPAK